MKNGSLHPEYIESDEGRIFVLARVPPSIEHQAVLVVPPFAEEMNKSRRMVTELALRLVNRGIPVVTLDLHGTGDSDGEFGAANWARWKRDVSSTVQWAKQCNLHIGAVLGIRLGCALALDAIPSLDEPPRRVAFWQPVLSGGRFLDQFLRLGVAAAMSRGEAGSSVAAYRESLRRGSPVEIAGYVISPQLANDLDAIGSQARDSLTVARVDWFEVGRGPSESLPTPSARAVEGLRALGAAVDVSIITGAPFWATTEVVVIPDLVDLTASRLAEAV